MAQNQPRLLLRKHSYYIRIFIPRKLQSVVKRKEIRYSLHTNNYFEALKKLRQESAKIDSWLEELGNNEDDMELPARIKTTLIICRIEIIIQMTAEVHCLRPLHIPKDLRIRLKTPKLCYCDVCVINQQNAGITDVLLVICAHL